MVEPLLGLSARWCNVSATGRDVAIGEGVDVDNWDVELELREATVHDEDAVGNDRRFD